MTQTLFLVPCSAQRRPGLLCRRMATGNPRQPLIVVWLDGASSALAGADRCSHTQPDRECAVPLCPLCA
ncbi:MAG TPA: hypothetical protein VME18_05235 [Acidobacteriaceae bacterium]|nr:hypothetical protein [Acidobacteriaceae bacterium]